MFRSLTGDEKRQLWRSLAQATPLQRRQLESIVSKNLRRYVHEKDVSNAVAKATRYTNEGKTQTAPLLDAVAVSPGWEVDIAFDRPDYTQPCGYYIVHEEWIAKFRRWPELIFIDGTYSVNRFNMPVEVVYGIDNIGKTFIAGVALLTSESAVNLEWVLRSLLKFSNVSDSEIKTVISDGERGEFLPGLIRSGTGCGCGYGSQGAGAGMDHSVRVQAQDQWMRMPNLSF